MGLLSKAEKVLERQYLEQLSDLTWHVFSEIYRRQGIEIMVPKTHFTGLNIRFTEVLQDMCFPGDDTETGKSAHIMCKGRSDEKK